MRGTEPDIEGKLHNRSHQQSERFTRSQSLDLRQLTNRPSKRTPVFEPQTILVAQSEKVPHTSLRLVPKIFNIYI